MNTVFTTIIPFTFDICCIYLTVFIHKSLIGAFSLLGVGHILVDNSPMGRISLLVKAVICLALLSMKFFMPSASSMNSLDMTEMIMCGLYLTTSCQVEPILDIFHPNKTFCYSFFSKCNGFKSILTTFNHHFRTCRTNNGCLSY